MAIVKEIKTTRGPVSYWVVGLIQLDNFAKSAYIKLLGFYDKEYADLEHASPIETIEINIKTEQYDEFFAGCNAVDIAYNIFSNSEISLDEESTIRYDLSGGKRG